MKNQTKIAVFFGGKVSQHLVMLKKAAKELGVRLDLVSYNRVSFETDEGRVKLRGNLEGEWKDKAPLQINDYDVVFFRTTGKHWEEVDLIVSQISVSRSQKKPIVVDPIVEFGKPSMACKAWQMLKLKEAKIEVPRTIYGSLWYLYEVMRMQSQGSQHIFADAHTCVSHAPAARPKNVIASPFTFPVIVKGSGGDRGTRVFKADSLEEMEKLVRDLRKSEIEEGKRYMLQEFIPNKGDYRVLVLGDKVLGVMKRASQSIEEFRNNYSAGGTVEVAELPEEIKQLAVKAAKVCGLAVAGVDVAFRNEDMSKPVIWEVNKGPQFKGFMKATGIDVPKEIVKFLANIR